MIRKQVKANPCYEGGKDVTKDIVTYNILNIIMFQILIIHNKCILYIDFVSFYDQKKEVICLAVLAIDDGSSEVTMPCW